MKNIVRALVAVGLLALPAAAQTSTAPGIDVEIHSASGSNTLCAAVGETVDAYLYLRPGSGTRTCELACGSVAAGPGHLATGLVEVEFDPAAVEWVSATMNSASTAAAEGILRSTDAASGRIGWTLGGNWTPDGSTSGNLGSPCSIATLSEATWVARLTFRVLTAGPTALHLRTSREFPLSFADLCGPTAFTEDKGDIDEVIDAIVLTDCATDLIFADGFDEGHTNGWTGVVGLSP